MDSPDKTRCDGCASYFAANETVEIEDRMFCETCRQYAELNIGKTFSKETQYSPEVAKAIRRQIKKETARCFVFAIPGFLLLGGALTFGRLPPGVNIGTSLGWSLISIAFGFCARARGRSSFWGLLALLACPGMIALNYLKRVCRNCGMFENHSAKRCEFFGAPV